MRIEVTSLGEFRLRAGFLKGTGNPLNLIRVIPAEGSESIGHDPALQAAFAAFFVFRVAHAFHQESRGDYLEDKA